MNLGSLKDMNFQAFLGSIQATVVKVITDPVGFFRYMQRGGGYVEPVLFMVVMGVVSGILQTMLNLLGFGSAGGLLALGTSIVLVPIMVVLSSFIGAGVLYVIWRLLGSQQSYECAYRCMAYAGAISPVTTVLNVIPYLGPLIGIAWMAFLMVAASVEIHGIEPRIAWIVFGILAGVLALSSVSSQMTARKYARELDKWGRQVEKIDQMAPEEAGKKVGEFLKGMQEGMGKKGQ